MTFSGDGGFEGGRVRRGRGRGAVAGGGVGLVAVVGFLIYQFTGVDVTSEIGSLQGQSDASGQWEEVGDCSVEEANDDRLCRLSATTQALDAYWTGALAEQGTLPLPVVTEFTGGVTTGCGQASSATGPFYCPADQGIYVDLTFFDLLQSRFGASGGALAEIYVTAHEYGHHVQNVTGVMNRVDRQGAGAESDAVRVELQADCYAGMAIGSLATTEDPDRPGRTFLEPITDDQLRDGLSAAAAVGDDHIQEQSAGTVDPDTWTHGSSEQRQRWFTAGYNGNSLTACDTFTADDL